MDERVVSLFSILSTFLMLDPAVCADPQTLEPCWRVIRMVRTYVLTYIHACIHMIFLRYKFRMKFLVRLPLSVLLYVSNV